ncbi:recombinase family protein [Vibrio harveyi]|uniref:recombinase family protein n=1 Tax=Vibrio harveyi TaxID=669 RepID=UPI003BB6B9B7
MNTAYLYARFSTKRQEDGDSLTRQMQIAVEYCKRNGLDLSDQTFEDLGVSAFKEGVKPALSDFIQAVREYRIPKGSHLLIEDDDRLSRRGWRHTQDLIRELVDLGVSVVIMKTGVVYNSTNVNDLGQNLVLMVNADRAHKESERKSHLIRSQRTRARESRKVTGKLPFWIVRAKNTLGFDFDPLKLVAVKRLVELRLQGKSMQGVAKVLNAEGFVTGTGAAWSGSGVRSIVQNAALYGAKEYFDTDKATGRMNKHPIDIALNLFPKVIEFETWQAMQQKSDNGLGGRVTRKGAFSGLLKCGVCGAGMTQRTTTYKGEQRLYRKCIKACEGSCTQTENVREPEKYLEKVLSGLQYQVLDHGYVSKTPELKQQLKTLEETQDILINAGLADKLADLYKKIIKVQEKIDESEMLDKSQSDPIVKSFKFVLDIEDPSERNVMLRQLLDRVEFQLLQKVKTTSLWSVTIRQQNGFKIGFWLDQRHGFGNTEIKMVSDMDKNKSADENLEDAREDGYDDWIEQARAEGAF